MRFIFVILLPLKPQRWPRARLDAAWPARVPLGLEEREPNAKNQYGEAGTDGQPRQHRRAGFGWVRPYTVLFGYHDTLANSLREIASGRLGLRQRLKVQSRLKKQ